MKCCAQSFSFCLWSLRPRTNWFLSIFEMCTRSAVSWSCFLCLCVFYILNVCIRMMMDTLQWLQCSFGEVIRNPADPVPSRKRAATFGFSPLPLHPEERWGDGHQLRSARDPNAAGTLLPGWKTTYPRGKNQNELHNYMHMSSNTKQFSSLIKTRTLRGTWTDTCRISLWFYLRSEERFVR